MRGVAGDDGDLSGAEYGGFTVDLEFDFASVDDGDLFLGVLMDREDAAGVVGVADDGAVGGDDGLAFDAREGFGRFDFGPVLAGCHGCSFVGAFVWGDSNGFCGLVETR